VSLFVYQTSSATAVDGDTLDVTLDLGFRIAHKVRLRLKGINCPEMRTDEGKAAKQFVVDWLAARKVTVSTFKDATEKYGRYLARVVAADGDLNTALVEAGHAVHKDY
jgi:micrococcal nuclease